MRIYFILFCVVASMGLHAQIQQNINKPSGVVSNPISEIDSIRFNAAGDEMQVVLQNGTIESHAVGTIDNVTFTATSNSPTHSCGADNVHNPALTYGSMTDQEGNVYKTIVIGTQEWMAENLKTGTYRNGDVIPNYSDGNEWAFATSGAWCYYNNDSQWECPFGKLYNWYTVADSRNICPLGWRVATDSDWNKLAKYIDPTADTTCSNCTQSSIAGGKLKTTGTIYWFSPNEASNLYGFSALGAGYRGSDSFGTFVIMGYASEFWTSTSIDADFAYLHDLANQSANLGRTSFAKTSGLSVRCVRE